MIRHDWKLSEVLSLLQEPFNDLLFRAQTIHREFFDPNTIQLSTLLSIKTGSCSEDCAYCPQSAHNKSDGETNRSLSTDLLSTDVVVSAARKAKQNGATRFCMGAAWRSPKDRDLDTIVDMVKQIRSFGMETCLTLGMLSNKQVLRLAEAGLDYYNHNLDTSPEFYGKIITTRTYQDRLDTLEHVRKAGIKVCCGGIIGMGESIQDRAGLLISLATLEQHPDSVPINMLVQVEGARLNDVAPIDPLDFVRTIAVARIMMPASYVRLSAGRSTMSEELQALCFFAGANSVFYGETLLTTPNAETENDRMLFAKLGIKTESKVTTDTVNQQIRFRACDRS